MHYQAPRHLFREGDVVYLPEPLFFCPPGRYRFEGVVGNIAMFSVGECRTGVDKAFLSSFIPVADNPEISDADEQRFVEGAGQLIEMFSRGGTLCGTPKDAA
jgi:hypothetical protein